MDSENIRSFNSVSHPVAPNGNNDIVSSLNWNGNVGVLPGTDMKVDGEISLYVFNHESKIFFISSRENSKIFFNKLET